MQFKQKVLSGIIIGGAILAASQFTHPSGAQEVTLSAVSATLSNPRLSVLARIASGSDTTLIPIKTSSTDAPSLSVDQLQNGDLVSLGGNNGPLTAGGSSYIVTNTNVAGQFFSTDAAVTAGLREENDFAVASQSSSLNVSFTTASGVTGDGSLTSGHFRVYVPSRSNSSGNGQDGIPDSGFFDFRTWDGAPTAATVTCPGDATNHTFAGGNSAAQAGLEQIGAQWYHVFSCAYTGTGEPGIAITDFIVNDLNNPAPANGHASGVADTYRIIVRHMRNATVIEAQTAVSVGVIEAVKITAEVPPQITFSISGLSTATIGTDNVCGLNPVASVTSQNTSVPLGELIISQFRTAAQRLEVATNASGGYVVTAVANDQLGLNGAPCIGDPVDPTVSNCIRDSEGDTASMTDNTPDNWISTGTPGFGYTLENEDGGATPVFHYNDNVGNCAANGNCFRQFADAEDGEDPVDIFNGSVTNGDQVNVCYKVLVQADQPAGIYSNYVTYRATATF